MKDFLPVCFLWGAFTMGQAAQTAPPEPAAAIRTVLTTEISPEGCTIDQFTVYSPSMGREIKTAVVLPPEYKDHPEKRYPILYAFHGTSAPYDSFTNMPPLRQALKGKPMIVTCFDADTNAFYIDSPYPQMAGRDPKDTTPVKSLFTTFFLDEFIPAIDKSYRVNPAQRMLTGYSTGGYGALHYMVAKPGEFVAVSSMSGWFKPLMKLTPSQQDWFKPLLGPYAANLQRYAAVDLYTQIEKEHAAGIKFPPIYLTCGTQDDLLESNHDMHDFLTRQGIQCEYHEGPGIHNWAFWEGASAAVIDFHWRALQKK